MRRSSAAPCASASCRGIDGRHAVVVVTVHHQQRSRRETASGIDGPEATQLPCPLVERVGEARCADGTDLARVLEEASRLRCPVVEIGARAEQRCAANPWVVGSDTGDHRAAGVGAHEPDACRSGLVDEVVDRSTQVVDPPLQREVTLARAASPKREGHRHPAQLVGDPIDQLREGAGTLSSIERTDRKAVTQDQSR